MSSLFQWRALVGISQQILRLFLFAIPLGGDSAPPLPEQPEFNSPDTPALAKDNYPFPKGISSGNIASGGRFHKPPNCFSGEVINKTSRTFKEAMASSKSDAWMVAIQNRFSSLKRHGVLEKGKIWEGCQLLNTTWVFREEAYSLGNVFEEKALLCVRGFLQIADLDFHETFVPTGRLSTLHFLLGYCADHDFDLHQMDVKTAFLHGKLDENLFIQIPEGYKRVQTSTICLRLMKSLYGLKQSPRNWYLRIKQFFFEAGFRPSASNPHFFIRNRPQPLLCLHAC
ncbi:hypothetical protein O181_026807 [Austropuccinia psidii MF-1]|uniref:Reverse transcriptase Ty1/copia-type domain-containing protein n=1 Tax=Austropuccinia psidii MF-1 TaxID=1389203 RepID=A0A9Q3H139_9BASI|nr:hypothetical protein [Austropuccinia psidii MF-1]